MATNLIVKRSAFSAIISILFLQGCSSEVMDGLMKGYADSVLGKDYIPTPELAAELGKYAKGIEVCKEQLSPQQYGLFSSDVAWYASYIDNSSEQGEFRYAFNAYNPTSEECKELPYYGESVHNIRLTHQKESIEAQNRRSQSSHTNCVETYNGLSCNTTPW